MDATAAKKHFERIASLIEQMDAALVALRAEVELIDGSDGRNRERRGTMRGYLGTIEVTLKWLGMSAGQITTDAYGSTENE